MYKNVFVESATLADIASAIRAKSGESTALKPSDMAAAIRALPEGDGSSDDLVAYLAGTLTSIQDDTLGAIGDYAFTSMYKLSTAVFPACEHIGVRAFYYCQSLTTANYPMCKTVGTAAFTRCTKLSSVSFPVCETVGANAFAYCKLTTAVFPLCKTIGTYAFQCSSLTSVSFPLLEEIGEGGFYEARFSVASFPKLANISYHAFLCCYNLVSLYLLGSSVVNLVNVNAFDSTPIGGYSRIAKRYGSIFVPMSLLDKYKSARGWTYYSSRIVGVEIEPEVTA